MNCADPYRLITDETLLLYFFRYLGEHPSIDDRSLGHFLDWFINTEQRTVFGMKVPTGFQLIGQTKLKDYLAWLDYFAQQVCPQTMSSKGNKQKSVISIEKVLRNIFDCH